jgi:hypothetical protein
MNEALTHLLFQRRPAPVLPEHRPLYKIAQVLLVLHIASRAGKSSLTRLHLFNWALKSPSRGERLSQAARTKSLNVTAWGFDPALAIALRYACAERLINSVSGGYELTDLGRVFAVAIMDEPNALISEKNFLRSVGKSINESMVDAVAKGWEAK